MKSSVSRKLLSDEERKRRRKAAHYAWVANNKKRSSEISMKWSKANNARVADNTKAWRAANKAKCKEDHKKWRDKQQERLAGRRRPRRCEVCGRPGRIHYDHSHKNGLFRGWICHGCNIALGGTNDSPRVLRALAAYLETCKTRLKTTGKLAKAQKAYAAKKAANALKTKNKKGKP